MKDWERCERNRRKRMAPAVRRRRSRRRLNLRGWGFLSALAAIFALAVYQRIQMPASGSVSTLVSAAYYPNCAAARAAGVAPLARGDPGYREELDADADGKACEPIPLGARAWR